MIAKIKPEHQITREILNRYTNPTWLHRKFENRREKTKVTFFFLFSALSVFLLIVVVLTLRDNSATAIWKDIFINGLQENIQNLQTSCHFKQIFTTSNHLFPILTSVWLLIFLTVCDRLLLFTGNVFSENEFFVVNLSVEYMHLLKIL